MELTQFMHIAATVPVAAPMADSPGGTHRVQRRARRWPSSWCARPAERTLRWFRADDLEVERKGDGTPGHGRRSRRRAVPAASSSPRRSPATACSARRRRRPPARSGRRWILDPIDGTKAFTCGVPLYSNLLALEDEHGIAVGVINLPALGETVWAGRGLGCFSDRGPARVSDQRTLDGAYVMSSSFSHWPAGAVDRLDGGRRRAAHLG